MRIPQPASSANRCAWTPCASRAHGRVVSRPFTKPGPEHHATATDVFTDGIQIVFGACNKELCTDEIAYREGTYEHPWRREPSVWLKQSACLQVTTDRNHGARRLVARGSVPAVSSFPEADRCYRAGASNGEVMNLTKRRSVLRIAQLLRESTPSDPATQRLPRYLSHHRSCASISRRDRRHGND